MQPLQGESDLEDFGFFKLCDNFLAAAFIKTGNPISEAICFVVSISSSRGPFDPGMVFKPACFIIRIASTLFPILLITFGDGPIKVNPDCSARSAKSAFSDKSP